MTTDDETPRHRIGAVARLTGISTHALRVWERRYGTLKPQRSDGGDRLYSDGD
ncbi:MerR family transcriptional regulator, partial [Acidobacteria bacterium ACD]|nr:MerR family transcriptional regulator [Acidobacteria bacterium ACD]